MAIRSMLRETHISLMKNNVSQNRKIKSLGTSQFFPFDLMHPLSRWGPMNRMNREGRRGFDFGAN